MREADAMDPEEETDCKRLKGRDRSRTLCGTTCCRRRTLALPQPIMVALVPLPWIGLGMTT